MFLHQKKNFQILDIFAIKKKMEAFLYYNFNFFVVINYGKLE